MTPDTLQTIANLRTAVDTAARHIAVQARQIDDLSETLDWVMQRVEQPAGMPAAMLVALGLARDRAAARRNDNSMEAAAAVVPFPRPEHGGAASGRPQRG